MIRSIISAATLLTAFLYTASAYAAAAKHRARVLKDSTPTGRLRVDAECIRNYRAWSAARLSSAAMRLSSGLLSGLAWPSMTQGDALRYTFRLRR